MSAFEALATLAAFIKVRSTFLTPKMVLMSSGQNAAIQIRMIAGRSPMPKNKIANGMSAMIGKDRKICTLQSMILSRTGNRPIKSPSGVAVRKARLTPMMTRETLAPVCRARSLQSRTNTIATADGLGNKTDE